ncbi:MAG: phosphate acetyltransferase [Candidatus Omnitrophica bacterium]|nr:phosphate acetyltransferase [Candidatus Omnitrophota bacterium]
MSRVLELREKAKKQRRKIVLSEGDDARVVKAASFVAKEKIADVLLLAKKDALNALAEKEKISLDGVAILDPSLDPRKGEVINAFFELRKHKGITLEDASKVVMEKFVYYGAVLVNMGIADGFVAGAKHTSGDVARSAIYCLKMDKDIGVLSGSFIIEFPDSPYGDKGLFLFADCGIVPEPTSNQLAGIAISSAELFEKLFAVEPRVAMLSYSTKGSASGQCIDKVLDALKQVKAKRPGISIDGELQLDAAIVPEVAKLKCASSPVAGKANVLIFPDLEAGNIAYKLAQRLGNARAIGPLLQGIEKPCSDLSRGCSWEDVVDAVTISAVRSQK